MQKTYLVTGAAGFIGFHLSKSLMEKGSAVIGVDNLNDYYDVSLKQARIDQLRGFEGFTFQKMDLQDRESVNALFAASDFDAVIHLAAQAGVRYSLENPSAYIDANIIAYFNILEACRHHSTPHLVYASSSSVYGLNEKFPFSVHDNVDHPISLYAASKKSNELMAHTYSHLFGLPTTGLRFFTVYGPWGRPDMALFKFCRSIAQDEPLTLFNHGNMRRDFTYIDDIIQGIEKLLQKPAKPNPDWNGETPDPGTSPGPYRVYNIGAGSPVELKHFLHLIEENMGKTTRVEYAPMQPGDVAATAADITDLQRDFGYDPQFPVEEGIKRFVEWFRWYYIDGNRPIPKM